MKSALLIVALLLTAQQLAVCQPAPSMPAWLADYPGAAAQTRTFPALSQSTYTVPAAPGAVREHYRRLFVSGNLPFVPSSDGIGTVIRGASAECDLLITIRQQGTGSSVQVSCAAKEVAPPAWTAIHDAPASAPPANAPREDAGKAAVEKVVEKVYKDPEAPLLTWPAWLVQMDGARPKIQTGVDQAGVGYLKSSYLINAQVADILDYYENLLKSHRYTAQDDLFDKGQTSGGFVEGTNYPNGSPGPKTIIHVSFSRSGSDARTRVELRFTAHPRHAPAKPLQSKVLY